MCCVPWCTFYMYVDPVAVSSRSFYSSILTAMTWPLYMVIQSSEYYSFLSRIALVCRRHIRCVSLFVSTMYMIIPFSFHVHILKFFLTPAFSAPCTAGGHIYPSRRDVGASSSHFTLRTVTRYSDSYEENLDLSGKTPSVYIIS